MAKKTRVGINGFGRIGRSIFRLLIDNPEIEVVVVNDIAEAGILSHLLKYDSIHGVLQKEISSRENHIVVDGVSIPISNAKSPEEIPWGKYEVDIAIECSGKFKTRELLQKHVEAGAKKVVLSVPPADDSIKTVVMGVNEDIIDPDDTIISNASCTTNNAAPMMKVLHDALEVEQAYITTVHSYTSDQSLHDRPHRDARRARAAAQSIIPTTTGAAKALTKIFPELSDSIGGCGIRVPVPNGSLTDMTLNVKKKTDIAEVNRLFKTAAENDLRAILSYTEDPIVSIDIIGSPYSCIFDSQMTSVIGGDLVKIVGWYDNEYGYSHRIIDLVSFISKFGIR